MNDADPPVPDKLTFWVAEDTDSPGGTMGLFRRGEREIAVRDIPVRILRESVQSATAGLRAVFDEVAAEAGRLRLHEVRVEFEVSAQGGVRFIGTAEVGSKGALTLVFRE